MFRGSRMTSGPAARGRGRGAYGSSGAKFRGSGGVGPWPSKGRRFVNSPYNNIKKTPKEQKQVSKGENPTPGAEDASTYRQKMMIVLDPERKLVENEIDQVKEALLEAFEPLEDGYFPQSYGISFAKGALVMTCANEQTKLWLERVVPKLKPWEGAKLKVKSKGDVGVGAKVQLKTPKLFDKTDPKKVLQMLNTQNKTLNTSTWKVVSVTTEDSGRTMVYAVDNQSLEAIRALNNKAYLGLGNVELVILNINEEGGKHTSVNADTKNEEEGDKQTSVVTEKKSEEESDKKGSEDTEMKAEEEGEKQTS